MIWYLFMVITVGNGPVHVLKGGFDTVEQCQDAMIAHAISAGFSGEVFESMYCQKQEQ